ncbi:hypothetical protein PR048_033204 [Dryococelus australis]|uniref:Uncharacterized protein n=1 Tax=Dryococelus australis TaxID=614101 RepID=A0ABQ9FZL1_9NEOP|nr:hypothetical protein PR048_033204 [Dryococelus australis]
MSGSQSVPSSQILSRYAIYPSVRRSRGTPKIQRVWEQSFGDILNGTELLRKSHDQHTRTNRIAICIALHEKNRTCSISSFRASLALILHRVKLAQGMKTELGGGGGNCGGCRPERMAMKVGSAREKASLPGESGQGSAIRHLVPSSDHLSPDFTVLTRRCDQYTSLKAVHEATVAERLACSPPTKANRVQSPAGSPDFREWESCRTMPLVGGFFSGISRFSRHFILALPHIHFKISSLTHFTVLGEGETQLVTCRGSGSVAVKESLVVPPLSPSHPAPSQGHCPADRLSPRPHSANTRRKQACPERAGSERPLPALHYQYCHIHLSCNIVCSLSISGYICRDEGFRHQTSRSKQRSSVSRLHQATVAERLACSPPTKANRVQSPAGSPDFREWESCRTMPLVGGFSRGSPVLGEGETQLVTCRGSGSVAVKESLVVPPLSPSHPAPSQGHCPADRLSPRPHSANTSQITCGREVGASLHSVKVRLQDSENGAGAVARLLQLCDVTNGEAKVELRGQGQEARESDTSDTNTHL